MQQRQSDDDLIRLIWDYMVIESPLAHADVIIVGGSKDGGTAAYAAELYGTGFAPVIVFSGHKQPGMDVTEADWLAGIARDRGVPESAILREQTAGNPGESIHNAQVLLAENSIIPQTVILVHTPSMSRRFLATAEVQWSDPKPTFLVRHENIGFVEYTLKHGRGDTFRKVMGDFQRMRSYGKKGFQTPQEIPADIQMAYNTLLERGHKTR
jgi:uncharacterized SAM-binding protein YcdF (DUF218 family)